MSQKVVEFEKTAMNLPRKEREKLAAILMRSLDNESLTIIEEAWIKEAENRFSAYIRGDHTGIPAEIAFAHLDNILQK